MATEFKDLSPEQVQLAAKMFWEIAKSFVFEAEIGGLVAFCARNQTHGYASLDNFFSEQGLECSMESLFISITEDFQPDFADLIKPLVLEKVQEELNLGEVK